MNDTLTFASLKVFQDQDEYFVSSIEKVDSVTSLRTDKVMVGVQWPHKLRRALETWPQARDLGAQALSQGTLCAACAKDSANSHLQLSGQPYNATSLRPVAPTEDVQAERVSIISLLLCELWKC